MSYKATFLFGLPDSKTVSVSGYTKDGTLAYSWNGNTDFHNHIDLKPENRNHIFIIWSAEPSRTITRPDVLINCINDPDVNSRSLKKAIEIKNSIINKWPDVKLFNDPEKIWDTSRNRIYELYNSMPHLKIPKTIRVKPDSVDNAAELAEAQGLKMPFIMRPCGAHQSEGLNLIENKRQLERYAYDDREFYIAEFIDYKSASGLYHKARLVMIGDKIYPRHYMTGESWMVHGDLHETYMANDKASKKMEESFLNYFGAIIKPEALLSLMEIKKLSGLDYLGFDFAIMPSGDLLIFEINAAQNSFLKLDFNIFPYMEKARDNIVSALNAHLERISHL